MSFASAEYFAKKHGGFQAIKELVELVNSGKDLCIIAEQFNLSTAQICRLRAALFDVVYTPKRGLIEWIEFQNHYYERKIQEQKDFIESQKKLTFIPGMLNGEGHNK